MKTVILAEKPSQARSYVEAFQKHTKKQGYYEVSDPVLPENTFITFGFGHLVELATPEKYDNKYKHWSLSNLPIFPENYKFIVPADKKKQYKIIKDLLHEADTIIIATDSDREGENIAWSIITNAKINLKRKTIKRLWINSLEKDAILQGFQNLKDGWSYYPAYKEAQTRQLSDWLIGMNGSPLYTLSLQKQGIKGVYSIGRVQTPTLYMVYKRDHEIKTFKPEPYLELNAKITANNQTFKAKLEPYKRFNDEQELATFMDNNKLTGTLEDGLVQNIHKQIKQQNSPRLFSLSSLQTEINKKYHASANETLKALQSLYEAKLLTYPRTDCNYITEQEFQYLKENLNLYLALISNEVSLNNKEPQKRYVNGSKVQEHHAIIMTKTVPTKAKLENLPKLQQQIYNLVLRTTLAMFADPYEYEETTILTSIGNTTFKSQGNTPKKEGWKALLHEQNVEQKEQALPHLTEKQWIKVKLQNEAKKTKPPKPFTEGTLITAMKTAGKTVDDEEAQTILKDVEGIGTEATRSNVLEVLKKRNYLTTEKNQIHVSEQGITLCKAVELEPLLTSAELTAKWEKALKEISNNDRTQENFLNQIKKFIEKIINEVPQQLGQSEALTNQVNKQKNIEQDKKEKQKIGTCPSCKLGTIIDKGKFYGCTNYQSDSPCKFTLPKKWSNKTLTKTAIKELINQGETQKIKGFKSKKTGNEFAAKLILKEGKLSFKFN